MHRLFIYGEVGAGKSTLCAGLCLYFMEEQGYSLTVNFSNISGTTHLYDWLDCLRAGKFPGKTPDDTFLSVDIGLENLQSSERIGITFFEASGEQTGRVVPTDSKHQMLDDRMERWLREAEMLLVVVATNATSKARNRTHQFLSYLVHRNRANIPIGFVVSKWDLVALQDSSISVDEYSAARFPESLRLLKSSSFTGGIEVFDFSIGKVSSSDQAEVIEKVEFNSGTRAIAEWIVQMRRNRG